MTRALVVYESMFGNTERVARAVALGLAEHIHVDLVRAGPGVTLADAVDLVRVGGPRHRAARMAGHVDPADGVLALDRNVRHPDPQAGSAGVGRAVRSAPA